MEGGRGGVLSFGFGFGVGLSAAIPAGVAHFAYLCCGVDLIPSLLWLAGDESVSTCMVLGLQVIKPGWVTAGLPHLVPT